VIDFRAFAGGHESPPHRRDPAAIVAAEENPVVSAQGNTAHDRSAVLLSISRSPSPQQRVKAVQFFNAYANAWPDGIFGSNSSRILSS
jgi:hypothetical protein